VIFGVLPTNPHEQAVARTGGAHGHAGERAAEAAVEMIAVLDQIAHAGKKKSKAKSDSSRRWWPAHLWVGARMTLAHPYALADHSRPHP
jgi:hypothetical protein